MATIKDVAALAGVSYTTVSHVINNSRPVSEHARLEVESAIRQLGYVPSGVARSLRHRTTLTIGLLVSNSTNPFFAELAHGIENACYQHGYTVVLCNSDDDPAREQAYLRVLLEKRIDGLIIGTTGDNPSLGEHLNRQHTPLLIVDRPIAGLEADLVCVNHEQGGYLATRHLVELGHRAIGCVTGPAQAVVSADRLGGYRRALQEAGLPRRAGWIVESDFTSEGGYQAGTQLLKRQGPTAVFACNDLLGVGLLRRAAEQGRAVPDQLSIVGFDDVDFCRYVHPALTSVGYSIRRQGELAASTLLERIANGGKGPARRVELTPQVNRRESAGPPPAGRRS